MSEKWRRLYLWSGALLFLWEALCWIRLSRVPGPHPSLFVGPVVVTIWGEWKLLTAPKPLDFAHIFCFPIFVVLVLIGSVLTWFIMDIALHGFDLEGIQ